MLQQFMLDVVANNPEYQDVNTDILYRNLLLLYYRKEKSSSSNTKIYREMLIPVVRDPLFVHAAFWGLWLFFAICGTKNNNIHPLVISVAVIYATVWLFIFFRVRKLIFSGNFQLQKTTVVSLDIRTSGSGSDRKYTKTICFANRFDTYVTHDESNSLLNEDEVYLLLINNKIKEVFRIDSYQIEYTDSYSDTCWNNNILDGKYVAVHGKENHEPRTYRSTLS